MSITIDQSKCTGCLVCTQVCLLGTFQRGEDGKPLVSDEASCIACGHCVAACPSEAISHEGVGPAPERPAEIASYDQLMGLLGMRRSRREFKPDPVPRDVIEKLLNAAIQAPNALNKQTVHYTVVTDPTALKQLTDRAMVSIRRMAGFLTNPISGFLFRAMNRHLFEGLSALLPEIELMTGAYASGRDVVLYDAPCVIIVHAPKSDTCGPEDAVYCGANILLAAEALGLGACVIGFITGTANRDPELRRATRIPADHTIHTSIALGYPRFHYARPAPKRPPNVPFLDPP